MKQGIGWKDLKSCSYGNLKRGGYGEQKGSEEKGVEKKRRKANDNKNVWKNSLTKPICMLIFEIGFTLLIWLT